MEEIKILINKKLEEKFNNGEVEKLIDESVSKLLKDILERAMESWSDPYKQLEKKLESYMSKQIEKFDFSKYLTKITDMLDGILKSGLAKDNNNIANNLKTILKFKAPEKTITLKDIFEKYCDWVKENCSLSYDDVDNCDDGCTYVTCKFEKDENSYSGTYIFKAYKDDGDELEDYRCYIDICKDYLDEEYFISSSYKDRHRDLYSIRNASEFEIYLMLLKQNFVHIIDFDEYMEDDVCIEISG